jgi:hypothetical protein
MLHASVTYSAPVYIGQETGVNGGAITQEATGNGSASISTPTTPLFMGILPTEFLRFKLRQKGLRHCPSLTRVRSGLVRQFNDVVVDYAVKTLAAPPGKAPSPGGRRACSRASGRRGPTPGRTGERECEPTGRQWSAPIRTSTTYSSSSTAASTSCVRVAWTRNFST